MNGTRTAVREPKVCACGSDAIEPEVLAPGDPGYGTHYSKLLCCDCGRFNGWGRDPSVTAALEQRASEIDALLKSPTLSEWERGFLRSICRQRHLTEKQVATWLNIRAKAAK